MADSAAAPRRADVWDVDLGDPTGHEAALVRPALIVSADRFNAHSLVAVCPVGRTGKTYPTRVQIEPGESGLGVTGYVQVEQVRTISTARLLRRRGSADHLAMTAVLRILRMLFDV